MGFKDAVAADRAATFLNLDEFGETVTVDGRDVQAVADKMERGERDFEMGVPSDSMRLFAKTEDLPARRKPGEVLVVDGRTYTVLSWTAEMGVAEVELVRGI